MWWAIISLIVTLSVSLVSGYFSWWAFSDCLTRDNSNWLDVLMGLSFFTLTGILIAGFIGILVTSFRISYIGG